MKRVDNPPSETRSSYEIHKLAVVAWSGLVIMMIVLGTLWNWSSAIQWQMQAGLIWLLVEFQTRRSIPLNHAADGVSYSNLGLANRLTIMRGWLIAGTGGFLFQSPPPGFIVMIPAILYAISAVLDRIDGYVARRTRHVSQMGIELDTVFDALGLAVAPLLAVWYGKIHWSYLLVSCAYYLFKWGIRYRQANGLSVFALKPRPSRRAIAGFQMGFVAVVLFPIFQPPVTLIAGVAFMLPVLTGFLIDWMIVSGGISDDSFINHQLLHRGENLISDVTQPLLRLILVAMLLTITVDNLSMTAGDIPNNIYAMVALCVLILLGILGRLAALMLVLLLGWLYAPYMAGLSGYIILSATIWILVLGTGRFSLYSWDQDWVNRYDGIV